jgi:hypothetical protein
MDTTTREEQHLAEMEWLQDEVDYFFRKETLDGKSKRHDEKTAATRRPTEK